jgi:hypothetical protein
MVIQINQDVFVLQLTLLPNRLRSIQLKKD